MNAWLEEDLDKLIPHSRNECSLDITQQERDPVMVARPRLQRIEGVTFAFKRGPDKIYRFTPLDVTIIHFTNQQLVIYQCCCDWTTGKALNESTQHFSMMSSP